MNRIDLHVHSCFSKHPSEWIFQRIGAQESYTDPETVYTLAKARGARFVTLTDHNTIGGALMLAARHPADCFVSVEATAYFPSDGCKVHVLCYGIDAAQFARIQACRENIVALRDYLRDAGIACSVAHATFAVNDRLTLAHIEQLLVLFNVFEGVNGTRGQAANTVWQEVLRTLTPKRIQNLAERHGLEPWGETPWVKGMTGGSDDHAGLFVGETYTCAEAETIPELLDAIRGCRTRPGGRQGDHKALAYAIYKIANDYTRRKGGVRGISGTLATLLFSERGPAWRDWLTVRKLGLRRSPRDKILAQFMRRLLAINQQADTRHPDWQVEEAYNALSDMLDGCFAEMANSLERGARGGEGEDVFHYIGALLPAALFSTPFFSTLRLLSRSNAINRQLVESFGLDAAVLPERVLWFSDTLGDLNGVSVTLHEVARCAKRTGRPLQLVGCLTPAEMGQPMPPDLINLPCIYSITPEFYDAHTLRVPSLLRAVEQIAALMPTRIIISTPGPVGLVGLAAARLLGVPCTGIYHTDFARQAELVTHDAQAAAFVESYVNWFFARMDEIRVPSRTYIDLLAGRGLDRMKMTLFPRGLDSAFAALLPEQVEEARTAWFDDPRPTLFYAGRLGREKNLELLVYVFNELRQRGQDVRLVIAGDGPELDAMKRLLPDRRNVVFTGRLDRSRLRACYQLADVFVFPSISDTFGMVVLEAQVFGQPCVVSDQGGPCEIIRHGETGYALPVDDPELWVRTVFRLVARRLEQPELFAAWRETIRATSLSAHSWENLIDNLTGRTALDGIPMSPAYRPSTSVREMLDLD